MTSAESSTEQTVLQPSIFETLAVTGDSFPSPQVVFAPPQASPLRSLDIFKSYYAQIGKKSSLQENEEQCEEGKQRCRINQA